jgi:protein TonB
MSDSAVSLPGQYSAGRSRSAGFFLALLAEGLLIILVLTFGSSITQREPARSAVDVVRFRATSQEEDVAPADEATEKDSPEVEPQPQKAAEPEKPQPEEPVQPQPPQPRKQPPPRQVIPLRPSQMATADITPAAPTPRAAAKPQQYGPPDRGGGASSDTQRVGTAPSGGALYAASWYREPYKDELDGYLSTATGPGWGLIACRTAPDYRVEDCVAVDEYPAGSNINRAILAAAWQFKVRPPRIGGEPRIGEWVRIRIDYGTRRQ